MLNTPIKPYVSPPAPSPAVSASPDITVAEAAASAGQSGSFSGKQSPENRESQSSTPESLAAAMWQTLDGQDSGDNHEPGDQNGADARGASKVSTSSHSSIGSNGSTTSSNSGGSQGRLDSDIGTSPSPACGAEQEDLPSLITHVILKGKSAQQFATYDA